MALAGEGVILHNPLVYEQRALCVRGGTGTVYRHALMGQRIGSDLLERMSARPDLICRGIALDTIEDPGDGINTTGLAVHAGRIVGLQNSEGADEIEAGHYGQLVYAVDDNTVALTDGGGTRSPAGYFQGFEDFAGTEAIAIEVPDNFEVAVLRLQGFSATQRTARGVVTSDVADLAAFTVAGNDGLTYAAGQLVLLVNQTDAEEDGPYIVGAVATGAAPLTRPSWWATESVQAPGVEFKINEGTAWKGTVWYAALAGAVTVGTSEPDFYPRRHSVTTSAMVGGTISVSTMWLRTGGTVNHSRTTLGGTAGHIAISTLTPGDGDGVVTLTSSSGTETSTNTITVHN
jgi:hypothetical protein